MKDFLKVTHHYFKDFFTYLKGIQDFRNQDYIIYDSTVLLVTRILAYCCHLGSRNRENVMFNNEDVLNNLVFLFGDNVKEIPHGDTINNFLKMADIGDFRKVLYQMVNCLIRKRVLEKFRIRGRWYQVIIDGVQLFSTNKPRVQGALVRHHDNGKVTYHTQVLVAYISAGNLVIPLDFEWIENVEDDMPKQDCETNAAKRLLTRIKEQFPKLPICVSGDALYFSDEMMKICKGNKWKYTFTLKEGRAPAFYEEFVEMKKGHYTEKENEYKTDKKSEKSYFVHMSMRILLYMVNIK